MAMIGMQSEMQCSYYPRHHITPDLNLNATHSMWPVNNVDRILQNGHCYNGGLELPFPIQQLACKEVVKQTILHHEAIFRNQIKELHHLYNRQRELMDELRKKELYRHYLWQKTASSTSAQSSFVNSQKQLQFSSLPWLNPGCNQPSVSGVKSNISCFDVVKQKAIQATCDPSQTKDLVEEPELLESKYKKVGRKLLDLELPAEEYIDIEEEEEETYVGETVECIVEAQTYHLKTVSEDVKKCVEELSLDKVQNGNMNEASFLEKSKPLADLNEPIKPEEVTDSDTNDFVCPVPGLEGIPRPDLLGSTKANFQIELQNVVPRTNKDPEDPEACSKQDCLCDNYETGQSSSNLESPHKDVSMDALTISSEEAENVQTQQISSSAILDQSGTKSKRKRKVIDSENIESDFSSCQNTSNELVPCADMMVYESPLVLSSRRHTHDFARAPVVVQALPCFNSSAQLKGSSRSRSSKFTGDKSHPSENVSSNPEFHRRGNGSASKEYIPRKLRKGFVDTKLTKVLDLNSLSPCCSSNVDSENISVIDGGEKLEANGVNKEERVNGHSDCHSVPAGKHLSTKQLVLRNIQEERSDFVCIDLNSFMNEDDSPSPPSSSAKIYLNAPVSPENKESSPPRGESDENQLETTFQLSGQDDDLLQELERIAAEVIVSISSSGDSACIEKDNVKPFELLHVDSLYWFARIVSSVRDDPGSKFGVIFSCKDSDHQDEHLSDGIDYFEAMTLSLKEINTEEYYCKTFVPEEEPRCASPFQSQPRKGQTRRCRQQRKEFQNEILPSLTSLSRYEVTEDLQAIGGMIEATRARRISGARKAGRNGSPRLRRRRAVVSSNVGNAVCLKQQTESSDLVAQLRDLGWTMVPRRRRGQRCRAINPRLILGVA